MPHSNLKSNIAAILKQEGTSPTTPSLTPRWARSSPSTCTARPASGASGISASRSRVCACTPSRPSCPRSSAAWESRSSHDLPGTLTDRQANNKKVGGKSSPTSGKGARNVTYRQGSITVPSGVDIKVDGQTVTVKGPKGELTQVLPDPIT